MAQIHKVLTIAGSDSGGGAGIQADIKAISALGAYACSVITSVTAQNTQQVSHISPVPIASIQQQLRAVFDDIDISAVKIGMLGDTQTIEAVASLLEHYAPPWIVLDPVMISKSGAKLLHADAITAMLENILPLADLVTPNLPEAAQLLSCPCPRDIEEMQHVAKAIGKFSNAACLLKGGHLDGETCPDLLVTNGEIIRFEHPRVDSIHTHGTGCTLSAAIGTLLAQGKPMPDACEQGIDYVQTCIKTAAELKVGHGHGPLHHFNQLWN